MKMKMSTIIVNSKGHWARECKKRKNEYAKKKLKQETLTRIAIRMVRLLFMHWLLLVRPMLGMWTLEHIHTLHCKNQFKIYENILPIKIYMGNNSIQNTIGKEI